MKNFPNIIYQDVTYFQIGCKNCGQGNSWKVYTDGEKFGEGYRYRSLDNGDFCCNETKQYVEGPVPMIDTDIVCKPIGDE